MIIEFHPVYALNFEENFEYIGTFVKGKKAKGVMDFRILLKGVKTGREIFVFLREIFDGKLTIEYVDVRSQNWKSDKHYRNSNWHYYGIGYDLPTLHQVFAEWRNSNPVVPIKMGMFTTFENIPNYVYTYRFDGVNY